MRVRVRVRVRSLNKHPGNRVQGHQVHACTHTHTPGHMHHALCLVFPFFLLCNPMVCELLRSSRYSLPSAFKHVVGFSATPYRHDDTDVLRHIFTRQAYTVDIYGLITQGYLCQVRP